MNSDPSLKPSISSKGSTSDAALSNFTDSDAELLLGAFPPPPADCKPLAGPVCLPQTVAGYDSPFARAFNPELLASGIEETDWLKFLDGLNIAIVC
jgi:hypothetical protein